MPFFGGGPPNIGKLKKRRDVQPLAAMLAHKDFLVRVDAAGALGKIGHAGAVAPLRTALQDEHPYVRDAAGAALKRLGAQAAP